MSLVVREETKENAWQMNVGSLLIFGGWMLTLPVLRLLPSKTQGRNDVWKNRHPAILVFIGRLSLSTLIWVPMCQDSNIFSGFLHHLVLAKLVKVAWGWTGIRIKEKTMMVMLMRMIVEDDENEEEEDDNFGAGNLKWKREISVFMVPWIRESLYIL